MSKIWNLKKEASRTGEKAAESKELARKPMGENSTSYTTKVATPQNAEKLAEEGREHTQGTAHGQ